MTELRLTATAQRDLTEAIAHVAEENPAAARRLRDRLVEAAIQLQTFPTIGTTLGKGRRSFVVPGTRFRLVYRHGETGILILRVHHGARQWPPAA